MMTMRERVASGRVARRGLISRGRGRDVDDVRLRFDVVDDEVGGERGGLSTGERSEGKPDPRKERVPLTPIGPCRT